ncbi:MAG: twin-arginine translocation signal domain-containing protein, partial [Micromonosporaceae bacterium]
MRAINRRRFLIGAGAGAGAVALGSLKVAVA